MSKDADYIEFSTWRRNVLKNERERTKLGPRALLSGVDVPDFINPQAIYGWFYESKSFVQKRQYDYILKMYRSKPNRIELSPERKQALLDERERTGIGSVSFLSSWATNPPQSLTASEIDRWLSDAKSALEAHYNYALKQYKTLPCICTETNSGASIKKEKTPRDTLIPLTDEMYRNLIAEKERTRIGAISLIRRMENEGLLVSSTLNAGVLNSWLSRSTTSAREDDFKSVMTAYQRIKKPQETRIYSHHGAYRIEVSDEFIERLSNALDRGPNFSLTTLLRRSNVPKGLTVTKISGLISGKTKTALTSHFSFLERMVEHLENLNES